jgi:hypothetical protein
MFEGKLKRKGTVSLYSIADILKPTPFHNGRPSLIAANKLKNDLVGYAVAADPSTVVETHETGNSEDLKKETKKKKDTRKKKGKGK